mmetsp:Transcript_21961/g.50154  ORF Transcript_21961/g.50154 Transcript_21961/m.50154 type:complete len:818 (-) Transcript_21961:144-2597(-)
MSAEEARQAAEADPPTAVENAAAAAELPHADAEPDVLNRLREHSRELDALRAAVDALRSGGGIADVRRVAQEAASFEEALGGKEALRGYALVDAGQTGKDIECIRSALAAIDECDSAEELARQELQQASSSPGCQSLGRLLAAWQDLQQIGQGARSSLLSKVDLGIEARRRAVESLSGALLDKVVAGISDTETAKSLADFLGKEEVARTLVALGIDVPDVQSLAQARDKGTDTLTVAAAIAALPTLEAGLSSPSREALGTTALDATVQAVPGAQSSGPAMATGGTRRLHVPQQGGSPELWHAVHVGDVAAIEQFIGQGECSAMERDASGHSVLWHSIAFGHTAIAQLMLDSFPPGAEQGVDVAETHPRKGITLLHLLCQSRSFTAATAGIFRRIAAATSTDTFEKVNAAGLTFLQMAASMQNFWVLNFVLRNFRMKAKALVCLSSAPALKSLAEVIEAPSPPAKAEEAQPFPEHFKLAEMLMEDAAGKAPYADVACDVGPENASGTNENKRFLAHRIVLGTQSPVLLQELQKLPLTYLKKENIHASVLRISPQISKEVWRSVLQFMYTGVMYFDFAEDNAQKQVELLRACCIYLLPKPLVDFAQAGLWKLLPRAPSKVALQVFSICAGSTASDLDLGALREASCYIILKNAHTLFEDMDADATCKVLERVVQAVESCIFLKKSQTPVRTKEIAAQPPPAQVAASAEYAAMMQQRMAEEQAKQAAMRSGVPQQEMQRMPQSHEMDEVQQMRMMQQMQQMQQRRQMQEHQHSMPPSGPVGTWGEMPGSGYPLSAAEAYAAQCGMQDPRVFRQAMEQRQW